jgi:hypothetical protein
MPQASQDDKHLGVLTFGCLPMGVSRFAKPLWMRHDSISGGECLVFILLL